MPRSDEFLAGETSDTDPLPPVAKCSATISIFEDFFFCFFALQTLFMSGLLLERHTELLGMRLSVWRSESKNSFFSQKTMYNAGDF